MTPETALALAGPGAVLCGRPRGVAHIYQGALTPSGRYIPRAARTACRAPHRRLAVLPAATKSSLDPTTTRRRVCARCSARLLACGGRAEPQPVTRAQYQARYAGLTTADLVVAVECATTAEEVDQAAHLSLLLHGHLACTRPATGPAGTRLGSLHARIAARRREFRPMPLLPDDFDEKVAADRRNRAAELHRIREDRIRAVGFVNATRR